MAHIGEPDVWSKWGKLGVAFLGASFNTFFCMARLNSLLKNEQAFKSQVEKSYSWEYSGGSNGGY